MEQGRATEGRTHLNSATVETLLTDGNDNVFVTTLENLGTRRQETVRMDVGGARAVHVSVLVPGLFSRGGAPVMGRPLDGIAGIVASYIAISGKTQGSR